MEPFLEMVEQRKDEIDEQIMDLLLSFVDFESFKEMMLFSRAHLVATTVETVNGAYTGRPAGTPSFREGKVTRTNAWLASLGANFEGFGRSWFYSDSINDLPLLSLVTHPVATNPDDRLARLAAERGWAVLRLFE